MTRLVLSFVAVTLSIMSTTDGIRLLSPIEGVEKLLFQSPVDANSRRNYYENEPIGERKVLVTPPQDPGCEDSNVVDRFTSETTNIILSSHKLYDIYSVSLSPEEAEVAYDRIVFNAVDNVNSCYPRTVSHIVSDAILATFGNLTLKEHVESYGHTIATYMKSSNVLTCEKLNELCDAYIFYVEQAACNVPHIKDRRNAYIQAASNSLVHFLSSLDLYTAGTVRKIAEDYANYLYRITGVPKCNKQV